jgi:hypothetical protein
MYHNVIKKLSTTSVLHDQVQLSRCLDDFIKLYNVRMPDQLQNMDLSRYPLDICKFHDPLLLKHFHSHSLASEDVSAKFHLAKCTLAYSLHEHVMADRLGPNILR